MKKARFLNSVGKKYIVGYGIVAVFSVVLLMVAVICNNYVSGQYDNAIGEMIYINNLENSVEVLNGDINMAYLYLSEEGTENYEQDRKRAEQYLKTVKEFQEKSFVREVTDAYCTVESFLEKSDFLTDALHGYFESDKQTGFEKLENSYNELQELYSYVTLRFQKAYSVKLNKLSQLENRLNALQQNILRLQIGMIVCTLICIGLYLTRVIMEVSRSIATMQKGVESIQDNVLSAEPIQIESNDEFEEFAAAFNKMTGIIQKQMREIEENADIKERLAEMEIKNLKMFSELQRSHLDFLQSRVNPHFLFNTLNMISSLARIENADQCAELMETTAAFLRYNLDNISKTVPLEKEVENLKDYVAIQECRYGGRYQYTFEIDEQCLNYKMPCMILQPMVENAIQHGIAMMLENGHVWIRIYPQGNRVCLEVQDNGVGMTGEQIRSIYEDFQENKSSGNHIGIRNIYRRLRLYYHNDLKFEFYNMDPGLKIFISLPGGDEDNEIYDGDRR